MAILCAQSQLTQTEQMKMVTQYLKNIAPQSILKLPYMCNNLTEEQPNNWGEWCVPHVGCMMIGLKWLGSSRVNYRWLVFDISNNCWVVHMEGALEPGQQSVAPREKWSPSLPFWSSRIQVTCVGNDAVKSDLRILHTVLPDNARKEMYEHINDQMKLIL